MSEEALKTYAVATTMTRQMPDNVTNIRTCLMQIDARSEDEAMGRHARVCREEFSEHVVFHQLLFKISND